MPYNTEEKRQAYLAKRKADKPAKRPRICCICGVTFTFAQGRTKGEGCIDCYTKYRCLYNLLHAAKYRATKSGLEFNLDISWMIAQDKVCPFTGVELTYDQNGSNYSDRKTTAASIDKINPSLGYTKDNCVIVSWWFNCAKQRFSVDEVVDLCKKVVNTCTTNLVSTAENVVVTSEGTTNQSTVMGQPTVGLAVNMPSLNITRT